MAEVVWTEEASRWLEDIFEYIAQENREAAKQVVLGIDERAQVCCGTTRRVDIETSPLSDTFGFCSTAIIESPISCATTKGWRFSVYSMARCTLGAMSYERT